MDEVAFWSAVAQISPVLGLAHVIETRQVIKHSWTFARWYRTMTGLIHFLSLFTVAYAGIIAILVLSGSLTSSEWLRSSTTAAISLSVGILILSPSTAAFWLAIAQPWSLLKSISLRDWWRVRNLAKTTRRSSMTASRVRHSRSVHESRLRTWQKEIADAHARRSKVLALVDRKEMEAEDRDACLEYIEALDAWIESRAKDSTELEARLASLPEVPEENIIELERSVSDLKERLGKHRRETRDTKERIILKDAGVEMPEPSQCLDESPGKT